MKALTVLFLMLFPILIISQCSASVSDLEFEVDSFQYENGVLTEWTSDMKTIGITTNERGLVYGITIRNDENQPVKVDELEITVRCAKTDESTSFFEQIKTYVYLPPNEQTIIYIPVDFHHPDVLGSYTAEITGLEAYPSEFRVVSEEQFEKELEDKQNAPFIRIGDINITLFDFSVGFSVISIGVAITIIIIWKKRN